MYYIDRAITELQKMHENYTHRQVDDSATPSGKNSTQDKREKIDEYFEKNYAGKDITNAELKKIFNVYFARYDFAHYFFRIAYCFISTSPRH